MTPTLYQQAMKLHQQGKHEESIEIFFQAINDRPDDPKIPYNLANVFADIDQYDQAIEYYKQSLDLDDQVASVWYNMGNSYLELKKYDLAVETYNNAIELKPNYIEALFNRGVAYTELDKDQLAIEDYSQTVQIDQNFHYGWYNLACLFAKQSDLRQSLHCLKEAIMTSNKEIDYRDMAFEDEYFEPIRRHPEFLKLILKQ